LLAGAGVFCGTGADASAVVSFDDCPSSSAGAPSSSPNAWASAGAGSLGVTDGKLAASSLVVAVPAPPHLPWRANLPALQQSLPILLFERRRLFQRGSRRAGPRSRTLPSHPTSLCRFLVCARLAKKSVMPLVASRGRPPPHRSSSGFDFPPRAVDTGFAVQPRAVAGHPHRGGAVCDLASKVTRGGLRSHQNIRP